MMDNSPTTTTTTDGLSRGQRAKSLIEFIGFWLLGLCNNFGYVVMLSAAHDILKKEDSGNSTPPVVHNTTNILDCNTISTGAILLADILPALVIKVAAPFFIHKLIYNIRIIIMVLFSAGALVTVGLSNAVALSLFGVACASVSAGFGEITILQLTSFYPKNTVSAWSSGTGAAGLLGSLSYTALTSLIGVKPKTAILILLFIPVLQIISYIMVGATQASSKRSKYETLGGNTTYDTDSEFNDKPPAYNSVAVIGPKSRLELVKPLLKYMIPLTLVYFAEYLINQGLYELIYFRHSEIRHSDQYRWYSVCYQLGVFLSRSSVSLFTIRHLWTLPIIQFINMGLFFACVFRTDYIPNIWLVFSLVVFEGLIGGGAYVNTFYQISIEIPEPDREFSMGVASVGDSFGITFAGLSAIPLHNTICNHFASS